MRLKLLFENIKHYFSLTCFIILTFVVIISASILGLEIDNFTYHISSDEYHLNNNDFDVVITSNTGLSMYDTRGEENKYDNAYERRIGFYNATILVNFNDSCDVVSIYEGTNENFNNAFNLNLELDANSIALSNDFAVKHNLSVGDTLDINLGNRKINYTVTEIVDTVGMVSGEQIFVTGVNVASFYGLKNMYNVILLDIKDSANYQEVYNHLVTEYEAYSVRDINDTETIKTLSHSTISEMMIIFCALFVVLAIVILKMHDQKLKKQEIYFETIGKKQYFIRCKLILYFILLIIAFGGSVILVNVIFDLLLDYHNTRSRFDISIQSYFIGLILPVLIILFKTYFPSNKVKLNRITYLIIISIFTFITLVLFIAFKETNNYALFLILFIIACTMLVVELIFIALKYILPFNTRVYIYDLGKKNYILTILQMSYIMILFVVCMIISCFKTYSTQSNDFDKILEVDKAVISKFIIEENNNYDMIRLNENGRIMNKNIDIIVGVDSVGYDKYVNFGYLTEEEKALFDSSEKYIVLSKYFRNIYNYSVGDTITLTVNDKDEEFKILKFVDHIYKNIVIVNNSNYLYYGYILNEQNIDDNLINDFSSSQYVIVNLKNSLISYQNTLQLILSMVKSILIGLIIIIILFSVYVAYEEYIYNQSNLRKMKLLGYNNNIMLKVSLTKLAYNLLLVIVIGSLAVSGIIIYIDDLLKMLKTVMYISFDFKVLIISLLLTTIAILIGYLYSIIKYRKIK